MTPRTEVTWLDVHADVRQIRAAVVAGAHSRYPVCRGRLDDVVGVVHVRQLAKRLLAGDPLDPQTLAEVTAMIPESTSVVRLVEMFRHAVSPLIVVLDEYVEGIVTPADVLGAIAGEM